MMTKMMMMMMKSIAVLLVAVGCCAGEHQADGRGESSSSCALCSITETIEAMIMEKVKVLETRLEKSEKEVETRLEKSEKDVEELRGLIGDQPQVAFSAGLLDTGAGEVGPFAVATPLKYQKVFSNTGNCYSPSTGVFTAQVKGMYFFRFSMYNQQSSHPHSVVYLKRNGQVVAAVWDQASGDANDMGSNAVVIPLEVGDNVWVELQADKIVDDDSRLSLTTFSGFLIFPM